jgi:hypothetical protein
MGLLMYRYRITNEYYEHIKRGELPPANASGIAASAS